MDESLQFSSLFIVVFISNSVGDFNEMKNGKKYFSRFSPPYFKSVMRKFKAIIGEHQRIRINDTLFAKWLDMHILVISSYQIDYFLNRFHVDSCFFVVGDDFMIPFSSSEFSIILGLHHSSGQPVDLDPKMQSNFLARHLADKVASANQTVDYEKLLLFAINDDDLEIDDFVSFYILLIFGCIVLPTGNYVIPSLIFPYIDDLTTFFNYAWGDDVF